MLVLHQVFLSTQRLRYMRRIHRGQDFNTYVASCQRVTLTAVEQCRSPIPTLTHKYSLLVLHDRATCGCAQCGPPQPVKQHGSAPDPQPDSPARRHVATQTADCLGTHVCCTAAATEAVNASTRTDQITSLPTYNDCHQCNPAAALGPCAQSAYRASGYGQSDSGAQPTATPARSRFRRYERTVGHETLVLPLCYRDMGALVTQYRRTEDVAAQRR